MSQSTLLSLPAEVRLNIYSYLFADEWVYIDPCVYTSPSQRRNRKQQYGAPLMQTCRQLRDEASPYYFANVRVCFDVCKSIQPVGLINWLDDIGTANVKLLRHFEMRWSDYVDIKLDLTRKPANPRRNTITKAEEDTNSTKKTQLGTKHVLTVQGIPEHEPEYWKRMGTSEFCDVLSKQLSCRLERLLGAREGLYLSLGEVLEFVAEADGHAGALRWLWFW
ncbi:hypothetical protein M409DRAFT_63866 [Zasmidium cellare ATCC 36951]|uniref:F-box domain-containing protein n=1 Tax=Zasmidium cellare ATCC 36951 TaxID=1080233 RepID=A0A6A6CYC4_ZASCE|nr:uncharacterized protein M409DRAFT_63866 [Zasmidium cellare ATCC 36951]KAF2170809.1 hypothetical protein M409DRAFT_63866 [Zasmidium cellare ATCC 36951]